MSLPGRVVRRPVATITILLVVLIIGFVSLVQTPLDLLPKIKPPFLAVITLFPGSSPQENLKLVTEPIESHLSAISGVKNIQSLSQEQVSLVALEFNWGSDLKNLRDEIGARLDLLTLPEGVQRPIIVEFDPTLLPIMQVSVSSNRDMVEMTRWLETYAKPRLEAAVGVASVQIQGGAKRDLFVRLYPDRLQEQKVSFEQVANILRASLLDLPAGIVEVDNRRMRIRILGRPPGLEELSQLVVGFQVDEAALEKMVGSFIHVDLNKMLSGSLPAIDQLDIPMKPVYLKDLAWNIQVDEDAEILILTLDRELPAIYGLTPEQLAALLPEEWPVELQDGKLLVALPPDQDMDWDSIRYYHIINIPDFEKISRRLQTEVSGQLDQTSQQIESALLDMAMAMILSSAGPGGGLAIPEDDFPLIPITLGSIAEIKEDLYPPNTINRINGNPSIGLSVQKEGEANTVLVARQARGVMDQLAEEFNEQGYGLSFRYVFDQAREIELALADLARALLLGSFLAIAILLLFLRNWRTILIIGLTIPAAVISAFALLYFAKLTINLMTLGALALAAGMLVDNSIVVSENIYRQLQLGLSPREAAVRGTQEVAGAIFASTLTTLSVFFPVVFLTGLAGEIFKEFALTVSCALLASLIIALTVIPLLASRFLSAGKLHPAEKKSPNRYRFVLERVLNYPWVIIAGGVVTLGTGIFIYTILGSNLFPTPEESSFSIEASLPAGTTLSNTDSFIKQLEKIVEKQEGIETYSTRVGESSMFGISMDSGVSNQGRIRVIVDPGHTFRIDQITEEIRTEALSLRDDVEIYFQRESLLDATGLDVRLEIIIQGPEMEVIKKLSTEAAARLTRLPNLTDVQTALEDDRPEIHIQMDHFKALRKGVTVYQVAMMLNQAMEGIQVARLETVDGVFNLVLGYRESEINTLEDIKNIGFYTSSGTYLKLGEVADFTESFGPLNIPRENQQVIGYIRAQFQDQDLGTATREAMAALDDMALPSGYTIREAASSQMDDIYGELQLVLLVAALLVYLVMAAQFESFLSPFIIICSLPLAFTGGVLALFITGQSLSIPAMIGGVILAGILVNDGIIMVDFINQQREIHGLPLREAILEGATARLRPILMTTITTILGLVPLALGLGEGSQLQAPMAIVIIGGQITGTLLLLVVIPAIYQVANRRREAKQTQVAIAE